MGYSPNTPEGGITADLVAPTTATGCDATQWGGIDATGMIALVSRGTCSFSAKSLAAAEAGALAVIVYNNADGELSGTLGGENPDHIPSGGILQADGQALLAEMADGPVNVTMELRVFKETRETFNVIAQTSGGDPDNVVMLGAHLDGVQDGPGINDNGTGSSALLEIAEQLTKFKSLNNTVRFAWWGAEESGLVGSTHYVNDLVTNDPEGLDAIATYLNFDMIGSPNYIIGVYDADESSYEASAPVPPGSIETEQMFRDYFDSVGQDVVDYQFSGRSDYQAFINNGVAAGGLSTGSNGLKSDYEEFLFGGASGVSYDPNYHSADDDMDNVAFDAFGIQADAIAHAVITLGYDTSPVEPAAADSSEHRLARTALPDGVVRR
jgi:Zn-dependent M28 family amino/carboxypeptidase